MAFPVVTIDSLTHRYIERVALDALSLNINEADIFCLLGPNGSGKSTLFRILSTLVAPQSGTVRILGWDVLAERAKVRLAIGVVFQSPALDIHLTAEENLTHHGHLYGLAGATLRARVREMLERVQLADRAKERIKTFSGGMRRRVELAKGLLHRPRVLILDEPSTGLDPGSRIELWHFLNTLRERDGVTILLTTHLLDEAEHADRVAILDAGRLIACDSPAELKARIGGDVIELISDDPAALQTAIATKMKLTTTRTGQTLRLESERGPLLIAELMELFSGNLKSVSMSKPTLQDVFITLTGRKMDEPPKNGIAQ